MDCSCPGTTCHPAFSAEGMLSWAWPCPCTAAGGAVSPDLTPNFPPLQPGQRQCGGASLLSSQALHTHPERHNRNFHCSLSLPKATHLELGLAGHLNLTLTLLACSSSVHTEATTLTALWARVLCD